MQCRSGVPKPAYVYYSSFRRFELYVTYISDKNPSAGVHRSARSVQTHNNHNNNVHVGYAMGTATIMHLEFGSRRVRGVTQKFDLSVSGVPVQGYLFCMIFTTHARRYNFAPAYLYIYMYIHTCRYDSTD